MSENQIDVRISASTAPLAAGMQQAPRVVEQATQRMQAAFGTLRTQTSTAMEDMSSKVTDSVRGMAGSFGGLVDVMATTRGGIVVLAGAAALLGFRKAVTETVEMTESAMDLARVMGTSTNEASVWQASLEDLGASQGELEGLAKGMGRALKENEADINKLGLTTRDAAGNLRPMNELVLDGIQVLNGYKEGADRTIASTELFGRGLDASSRLLLLNKDVLEENRQAVQDLGLETGANAVAAWQDFDAATDRAGLSMQGIVKAVGQSVMPAMTDLVRLFNAVMPAAIAVVRGALSGLTSAFLLVKNGVVVLWETINALVITAAEPIRALSEAIGRAMTGDFVGAGAAIKGVGTNIAAAWGVAMQRMTESSTKTAATISGLFSRDTAAGDPGGSRGSKSAPNLKKDKKASGEVSQIAVFEAQLEAEKVLATERDAIHGLSKQAERDFWANILATAALSDKDRTAIARKESQLRVQVLQQEAREQQQLSATGLGQWRDAALARLALDLEAAKNRVALGLDTQAELLAQEQSFEQQRFEIQSAALRASEAALDPQKDPVQIAQIHAQIEALEQAHQLRLAQIRGQIAVESSAELNAIWGDLSDRVSGLWDKGVNALINGTLTWRGAMRAIGAELTGWFAQLVKKKVLLWAVGEQAKTGASLAGTVQRGSIEALASAKSIALGAITAAKNIISNAAQAAAAAYQAVVGIPFIGPFLAPAAAAVAFAGVAAFGASVSSAEGGYDIPAGVNPMTQLHEREMVLPAKQADVIRDLADGDGAKSGGPPINIITTGGDFIHKRDLAKLLKQMDRNFVFNDRAYR